MTKPTTTEIEIEINGEPAIVEVYTDGPNGAKIVYPATDDDHGVVLLEQIAREAGYSIVWDGTVTISGGRLASPLQKTADARATTE